MYQKKSVALGPQIPVAASILSKLSPDLRRNVFRSMIQLAVNSLEGREIPEGALDGVQVQGMSMSQLYESYAGILSLIQAFLKLPQGFVNADHLKDDLKEVKFPEECTTDLISILYGPKRLALDERLSQNKFYFVLSRVLEPSIIFDMVLSNGQRKTFEVSISKFHQVRYNVASVLKEMETMEKKKLFKQQSIS
ncbi:COMM domain-containing protein 5 [Blattella germanica]|nr:COMM domain-containing protein 5 [Blattella germanica]